MNSIKYTLDRFDDGFAVFLQYPDEEQQLLIPISQLQVQLQEGDVVLITGEAQIQKLSYETESTKQKVQSLIDSLKKRNP